MAIRVPEQRSEIKPFLIVRTLDGPKVIESIFGYAERRTDSNEPMKAPDLQRSLRSGLHFERTLAARFDQIEVLFQNPPHVQREAAESAAHRLEQRLEQRIDGALAASDFADERALVISAFPTEPAEVTSIFSSGTGTVRWKLEHPPTLRSGGWDLATEKAAEIVRGELLRIRGFRKILDLFRDGTFVFACVASNEFLAWTSAIEKLHPIALVEIMYNFCAFYRIVGAELNPPPKNLGFRVAMRDLHKSGIRTKLGPGTVNSIGQIMPDYLREAPDDLFSLEKKIVPTDYDPEALAFELLREVYLWFGLPEDKVPYVRMRDDRRVIDLDALHRG